MVERVYTMDELMDVGIIEMQNLKGGKAVGESEYLMWEMYQDYIVSQMEGSGK